MQIMHGFFCLSFRNHILAALTNIAEVDNAN